MVYKNVFPFPRLECSKCKLDVQTMHIGKEPKCKSLHNRFEKKPYLATFWNHNVLRQEAAIACTVGGVKNPTRLTGRHFPHPLPQWDNVERKKNAKTMLAHAARQQPKRKILLRLSVDCKVALCVKKQSMSSCFEGYLSHWKYFECLCNFVSRQISLFYSLICGFNYFNQYYWVYEK